MTVNDSILRHIVPPANVVDQYHEAAQAVQQQEQSHLGLAGTFEALEAEVGGIRGQDPNIIPYPPLSDKRKGLIVDYKTPEERGDKVLGEILDRATGASGKRNPFDEPIYKPYPRAEVDPLSQEKSQLFGGRPKKTGDETHQIYSRQPKPYGRRVDIPNRRNDFTYE